MGRIVLVGGGGFVGAHLGSRLLAGGHDVLVLDGHRNYLPGEEDHAERLRRWRHEVLLTGAEVRRCTLDDPGALRRQLRTSAPAAVVHLANLPLAAVAGEDPALARRAIVDTTGSVLAAIADAAPSARLTFVSSSMVYGDFARQPQDEVGPTRPREPYGACKLQAERLVRGSRLAWTIVRPSAVYGPGDANGRFLQRLVEAAVGGDVLELRSNSATRLDFTWVGDLAEGLASAALEACAVRRTFNLTAGRSRSLGEAIAIVRKLGRQVEVRPTAWETFRPRRGTLDISLARAVLGFDPRTSLEDGLLQYLSHVAAPAAVA